MEAILDQHVAMNMNTVVFQVFTHGMAFYDSERLPWSPWLAGEPSKDPGWDPLAFAVEQAHERGLELHAWINVYQMGNPNTEIDSNHVRVTHPEWIKTYPWTGPIRDYWINPADPDAREWLLGNILEIVENYDIDAIHFDFIRYPENGFSDDHISKTAWPNGKASIFDWRRENINIFVREVYAAVKEAKPWVKVGSAPIGTYKNNGIPGFWAWDNLYQESRLWLEEGVHDYVAPQLYFDIGTGWSAHDFSMWLQDWINSSHGRHVYAGHGTWREVFAAEKVFTNGEIADQIDLVREFGAQGSVHFRYQFTNSLVLGGRYDYLTLPAPMPWRQEASAPTAPSNAQIEWDEENESVTVSWNASAASVDDPLRRYAVFRSEGVVPDLTTGRDLVAILGPQDTTYTESFSEPPRPHVYYTVVAQSQYGMLSDPSATVSTESTPLATNVPVSTQLLQITDVYPNPAVSAVNVRYEVPTSSRVEIILYDMLGRRVSVPYEGVQTAGWHEVKFEIDKLAPSVYILALESDGRRDVRKIVLSN